MVVGDYIMLRIYPSEEGFDEIFRLVTDFHQLTNAHMYQDLKELSLVERLEQLDQVAGQLEEQLG
jgi:hypothetical protein